MLHDHEKTGKLLYRKVWRKSHFVHTYSTSEHVRKIREMKKKGGKSERKSTKQKTRQSGFF